MAANHPTLWTIQELEALAHRALEGAAEPGDARVRDRPDLRTIRYYTTLGLVDRPSEMRGRTALYSERHLRQLVAIKRLQRAGHSLADVQTRLAAIDDRALARIARVPVELAREGGVPPVPQAARARRFWAEPPGEPPAPVEAAPAPLPTLARESAPPSVTLQSLDLAPGMTLLIASRSPLADDDVAALRGASAPLFSVAVTRGLVEARGERIPDE